MSNEIRCEDCNTLFGRETAGDDGLVILQIKNRDLYRYVSGGIIWGPCRGCGKRIEWTGDDDPKRA
jgi:hypothetical protein